MRALPHREVAAATEAVRGSGRPPQVAPLVFSPRGGEPLGDKGLRHLLRKHGITAVPHGFRSSFRDWAAEKTDYPREVVEAALAYRVQDKVEAAYGRTDLFERRHRLMGDGAVYLAGANWQPLGQRRVAMLRAIEVRARLLPVGLAIPPIDPPHQSTVPIGAREGPSSTH